MSSHYQTRQNGPTGRVGPQDATPQLSLFGETKPTELEKRDRGIAVAVAKNPDFLDRFRELALEITPVGGLCHMDLVREEATDRGVRFLPGNWQGATFLTRHWAYVDSVRSSHVRGHARRISRWRRIF